MSALKTVIWAIDPFEANTSIDSGFVQLLTLLSGLDDTRIQPVYVLSASQLNLAEDVTNMLEAPASSPTYVSWMRYYEKAAENSLRNLLKNLPLKNLMEPKVLLSRLATLADATDLLSNFARLIGAELILVGTHGRKGMRRVILGSFAETLLSRSKIDVIVVKKGIRLNLCGAITLLFPSEFGAGSQWMFRRAVQIARYMRAKLILFHSVPHPFEPLLQSGVYLLGGVWIPVSSFFRSSPIRQRRRAEAWARWAVHQGVPTDAIVIDTEAQSISDEILNSAQLKKADFILMETQVGRVTAALVGSITRQVIRGADCPIWVPRIVEETVELTRMRGREERKPRKAA